MKEIYCKYVKGQVMLLMPSGVCSMYRHCYKTSCEYRPENIGKESDE